MNGAQHSGWTEWSKHVLMELERLAACIIKQEQDRAAINIKLAELKTEMRLRATFWTAIGAAVGTIGSAVLALIIYFITQSK